MNIQQIKQEAQQAAVEAQQAFLAEFGERAYCGFAWVDVYVSRTNSKEANALKEIGFKRDYKPKCLNLWAPGNYHGQSMDVLEEGARAFAKVLQKYGFRAYAGSRAD
jgi:hypothetical protein